MGRVRRQAPAAATVRPPMAKLTRTALCLGAALWTAFATPVTAKEIRAYGPTEFVRTAGPPNQYQDTVYAPGNPEPGWFLEVWNGDPQGERRISAATLLLNGISLLPASWNQTVGYIKVDVTSLMESVNSLDIELRGSPEGFINVAVTSMSSPLVLMAQKCGAGNADVCLTWTGGTCVGAGCTVMYDLYRSSSPTISAYPATFLTNSPLLNFTNTGAANDGVSLWFYVVSDQTKPPVAITNPLPGFTTSASAVAVSGTQTGAGTVYVNDTLAALGAGTFDVTLPPGVPLALGANVITATGKEPTQLFANYTPTSVTGTKTGGQSPPVVQIFVSTPCLALTPADGTTLNARLPLITVGYSDPDGQLDTTSFKCTINGLDATPFFTVGVSLATLQMSLTTPRLVEGTNVIVASIADKNPLSPSDVGAATVKNAVVLVSPPSILSVTPPDLTRGANVLIDASTTPVTFFEGAFPQSVASFNGVDAAPPSGGDCAFLGVTIPSTATSGLVKVRTDCIGGPGVNCLESEGFTYRIMIAPSLTNVRSVEVTPAFGPLPQRVHIAAGNNLYEWDGSALSNVATLADALGVPHDADTNIYIGRSVTSGEVYRFPAGGGALALYANTKITPPEADANVLGLASDGAAPVTLMEYLSDGVNGKIKRIDPGSPPRQAVQIASGFTFTAAPAGIALPPGATLYFFTTGATNNFKSLSVPTGGTAMTLGSIPNGPRGTNVNLDAMLISAFNGLSGRSVGVIDKGSSPCCDIYDLVKPVEPTNSSIRPIAVADACFPGNALPGGPCPAGTAPAVVVADRHVTTGASRVYFAPPPTITMKAVVGVGDTPVPTKVFADFKWDTQTDTPDSQSMVLKVTLGPTTLIPATATARRIEWFVEDPDDPTFDPTIDPNFDAGLDNRNCTPTCELCCKTGSATIAQFVEVPTYTLGGIFNNETKIVSGVSQVRVNLPPGAGDNVRVTARLVIPTFGRIEAVSPVITVWKKLHVERDSMGPPIGPMDIEDPPLPDVPDPDATMVAGVYRPAFIEVVYDTGEDSPTLPFRYAVPATLSSVQQELKDPCRGAVSSRGYWAVRVKEIYEYFDQQNSDLWPPGDAAIDRDPESEDPFPGFAYVAVLGQTNVLRGDGAALFYEITRDWHEGIIGVDAFACDEFYTHAAVMAHEIGHELGLQHTLNPTIMQVGCKTVPALDPTQTRFLRFALDYPGSAGPGCP